MICVTGPRQIGVMLIKEFVETECASSSMGNGWQRSVKWRGLR